MSLLYCVAPIKLNLNLHIIGLNAYGYHLLEGVTVFASDGDMIEIALSQTDTDNLIIHGDFAPFLQTENPNDNLIIKAIQVLRGYQDFPFVTITLEKNIPIQAGYGGGSSDAATILKNLNVLFDLNIPYDDLIKIGQSLGADVPMCLYGKPCFVQNIGDMITPLSLENISYYCLLLKPNFMLSTAQVFKGLQNKNNARMPQTDNIIDYAIMYGRNDLWQPACAIYPKLQDYLHALQDTNPIKASMSGSGSGLFALYDNQDMVDNAYKIIIQKFPSDFVKKTVINSSKEY